jgi:hypothetical protein
MRGSIVIDKFRKSDMKPDALKQAWQELHKAERAHHGMTHVATLDNIEDSWKEFLFAVTVLYNKLNAGSKGNAKSVTWFNTVKHERKIDPLLSYLHHARDVATHGIARIAEQRGSIFAIKGDFILNGTFGKDLTVTPILGGAPVKFMSVPAHLELIKVVDDRFGTEFEVPEAHLGQVIYNKTPHEFSRLALIYLRDLLGRAASLV